MTDYSPDLRRALSATNPRPGDTPSNMRRSAAAARFAHAVHDDRRDMVKKLAHNGKTDPEIARALGITADEAREYRTRQRGSGA